MARLWQTVFQCSDLLFCIFKCIRFFLYVWVMIMFVRGNIFKWNKNISRQKKTAQITVRRLSHFVQPVKWLWQQKSIYYDCMCIVDYVRISKRLSDNICKTKGVVSVKISPHDAGFTWNHFKFHFLWKTYDLVSDDFRNLSAARVFVGTNGEDVKNMKTAKSLIDHFHC